MNIVRRSHEHHALSRCRLAFRSVGEVAGAVALGLRLVLRRTKCPPLCIDIAKLFASHETDTAHIARGFGLAAWRFAAVVASAVAGPRSFATC